MKRPSFQVELFPARLAANLDQYEYEVPGVGWVPVETPGSYARIRRVDPGQHHTLDTVHELENALIHARFPERLWRRELERACGGSTVPERANVWQRLRALARCLEEVAS